MRPVLLVNGGAPLIVEHEGLTEAQAVLVIDGYVDGLRNGGDLSQAVIQALLRDPLAVTGMEAPCAMSTSDLRLFKLGALGGLSLAAHGYWMDKAEVGEARTIH